MSPPPPSSLELLLLERAKALQQHHHHQQQQQQQHHSANNITSPNLKPFPHFPSQGFGSLRPGLFPPASPLTNSNSSGLGGGFHSGPEELLQRWRQQLPHMPANIQEDSRMDITAAPPAAVTPTQSSPGEKTTTAAAADSLAGAAFSRPDPSPSPTGSLTHREQAVSPPTSNLVEDLPPAVAVLNGGNIGDRQLHAEGETEEENLAAVEEETKEQAATAVSALTDIDRESPGRCQENSSPVKSEDSNLGELMTPQLPALSPLSPYSSALGLGLPSLLSSASR